MSNCAAINTSLTYLIKTNTICGVKKKKEAYLAGVNLFMAIAEATYIHITADIAFTTAHVSICPTSGTQP